SCAIRVRARRIAASSIIVFPAPIVDSPLTFLSKKLLIPSLDKKHRTSYPIPSPCQPHGTGLKEQFENSMNQIRTNVKQKIKKLPFHLHEKGDRDFFVSKRKRRGIPSAFGLAFSRSWRSSLQSSE